MISAKASCIIYAIKCISLWALLSDCCSIPRNALRLLPLFISRARQEVWMVGDGGAWTEAQRSYLNHATLLVFILCLSFKARY